MRKLIFILIFHVCYLGAFAQDFLHDTSVSEFEKSLIEEDTARESTVDTAADTNPVVKPPDTSLRKAGSLQNSQVVLPEKVIGVDTAFQSFLRLSGFKNIKVNANADALQEGYARSIENKDGLFYSLLVLFLFVGLIKNSFEKYFNQVFTWSFHININQKKSGEQIYQHSLPSVLLNILFVLSGSLLLTLLSEHYQWVNMHYWQLLLYSAGFLVVIYVSKYLFIQFIGWAFKAPQQATNYNYRVFFINKLIGIILLPVLLIIGFAEDPLKNIIITLTFCLLAVFLIYRFFTLASLRKNLNVTAFHFFIYLCAIELMPLLIIYKVFFSELLNRT